MAIGTAAALAGVGALASFKSGADAYAESKRQARLAEFQANQQAAESARQGQIQADQLSREAESTLRAQKVAYLKSGVSLEGSPLLVMEGTRIAGQQNAAEAMAAGSASAGAAYTEGRVRAQQLKSSGRQAFVQGIGNAAGLFSRVV